MNLDLSVVGLLLVSAGVFGGIIAMCCLFPLQVSALCLVAMTVLTVVRFFAWVVG